MFVLVKGMIHQESRHTFIRYISMQTYIHTSDPIHLPAGILGEEEEEEETRKGTQSKPTQTLKNNRDINLSLRNITCVMLVFFFYLNENDAGIL